MNSFLANDTHSNINASAGMSKPEKSPSRTKTFSPELAANNMKEIQDQLGILSFTLNQFDSIICVIDGNANLIFVNTKACESLGYSQDELLAMSIDNIAPNFEEEILVQSSLIDYDGESSIIIDMYYKTKTKGTFPVEVKISPFMSNGLFFSLVAKDVSARTPFYNLISDSEKQEFFALVENLPDIILRYDLSFWCTYVNEACERILGYSRHLISENFFGLTGLLSNEQIRLMKHNLRLVIDSGLPLEFELILAHATSGLPVYLQVIVVPEFNAEHKIAGVMAVAHDISDLKHKEKEFIRIKNRAVESNKVKSSLLEAISSEMRSPASTVIGLSRLLKDETLSQEERNVLLDLIDDAGMKIERMREGILDLLKIKSDNLDLNLEN